MTFDSHEHLREELHLYPLHLQSVVKAAVERAYHEGYAAGAVSMLPATPSLGDALHGLDAQEPTAHELLAAQRASTDAINAGVEERRAARKSSRPPKDSEP